MDDIIDQVAAKTGMSREMAETAVRLVLGWVKTKLPDGLAPHVDTLTAGGDLGSIASGALGGLFGSKD